MSIIYFYNYLLPALIIVFFTQLSAKPFLLMVDPAGSAQDTGRLIDDVYERSLTLDCAQKLKQELEKKNSNIHVVLTRAAGESVEPLQNAHFANRLRVDLYIRLQFFYEKISGNSISIYYFSWGNNESIIRSPDTAFIPYDKAHMLAMNLTQAWARKLAQSFDISMKGDCKGIFAIPCSPLLGITAPALCLEIGLLTKHDWHAYVNNIVEALHSSLAAVE